MMLIDANDSSVVREMEELRTDLLYDRRSRGFYDLNDFMAIRTTNHLDEERVVKPLCHIPFITKNNSLIRAAVEDILNESEPIDFYMEEDKYTKRSKMIREMYLPYSSQYRSTVHFSINGLVSSHSKGNFDGRKFIIIDQLSYHLQNNDIRAFRLEDTYMYGDVKMSPQATILIRAEEYDELLLQYPQLKNYNVVLYRGDAKTAVEIYLTSIGIISEKIEEHGAVEHKCSDQIRQFRDKLKKEFNIGSTKHVNSEEYKSDDMNNLIIFDYYSYQFYSFMLKQFGVEDEQASILLQCFMDNNRRSESKEYLKKIIKDNGLEKFSLVVSKFNTNILDGIGNGTFKNNEELVSNLKNSQKS